MSPSEPPVAADADSVLVYPDLAGLVMLTNTPVATALAVAAVVALVALVALTALVALVAFVALVAVVADVAVAALPVMLMFQVPDAFAPVVLGAPIVL